MRSSRLILDPEILQEKWLPYMVEFAYVGDAAYAREIHEAAYIANGVLGYYGISEDSEILQFLQHLVENVANVEIFFNSNRPEPITKEIVTTVASKCDLADSSKTWVISSYKWFDTEHSALFSNSSVFVDSNAIARKFSTIGKELKQLDPPIYITPKKYEMYSPTEVKNYIDVTQGDYESYNNYFYDKNNPKYNYDCFDKNVPYVHDSIRHLSAEEVAQKLENSLL